MPTGRITSNGVEGRGLELVASLQKGSRGSSDQRVGGYAKATTQIKGLPHTGDRT